MADLPTPAPPRAMSEPSMPPADADSVKKRTFTLPTGHPITVLHTAPPPEAAPSQPVVQVVQTVVDGEKEKPKLLTALEPTTGSPAVSPMTMVPEVKEPIPPLPSPEKTREEKEVVKAEKEEKKAEIDAAEEKNKEAVEANKDEKKAEIEKSKEEETAQAGTKKEEKEIKKEAAREEKHADAEAKAVEKIIEKEAVVEKKAIEKEAAEAAKPTLMPSTTMPTVTKVIEPVAPVLAPAKTLPIMKVTEAPVAVMEMVPAAYKQAETVPVIIKPIESTQAPVLPVIHEAIEPAHAVVMPVKEIITPVKENIPTMSSALSVSPAMTVVKVIEASPVIPAMVAPATTPVMTAKDMLPATVIPPILVEPIKQTEIVEKPVVILDKPHDAAIVPVIEAVEEKTVYKPVITPVQQMSTVTEPAPTIIPVMTSARPTVSDTRITRVSAGSLPPLNRKVAVFSKFVAEHSTTLRFSDKFHHQLLNPEGHAVFHFLQRHHMVDDNGVLIACIHKSLLGR